MESERKNIDQTKKEGDQTKHNLQVAKRYLQFIKPYRKIIFLIIFLGILTLAAPLVTPYMTKIIIDDILLGGATEVIIDEVTGAEITVDAEGNPLNQGWSLQGVVILLAVVFIFSVVVSFIRNWVTAKLGNQMVYDIRKKLYVHLQKLSPNFYDNRHVGGVVSRVLHDVNGAQNLVGGGVINAIVDLFVVFFAAILLFQLDWRLALLSLWILPMYYLTFTNLNVRIRFAWRSVHRQMERISSVLVERISGMKVVQSFNREKTELERFDKQSRNHYQYSMSAHLISNILGTITQSFNHIGTLIIWLVGGMFVLNGQISVGTLVAFQAYLMQMYGPIQRFSQVNITIQNSLTNVERIFEVFDYHVDIQNKKDAITIKECDGDLVFENVSFNYVSERPVVKNIDKNGDPDLVEKFKPEKNFYFFPPKTRPGLPPMIREEQVALKNINFHAKPGEVIALVGASGAGKSTLINLIPRFYDPIEGRILLDGRDLRDYDVMSLRKQIALVLQDNILFSGTVYENIVFGRPEATKEEVLLAAKAANAHEFISSWEKGYETMLGERGVRLSGGQKQRVAIARALLKDPRILILDEATSALDAESESLVTAALETLMENRTTFIIAHRLATVVRANQILVLDDGEIVEQGTHEELLKHNGVYRDLYEKQLRAMRPEELEKIRTLI